MSLLEIGVQPDEVPADDVVPEPNLNGTNPTERTEPSWWWDDNTPGNGDRPEYLPEKFKRVSDIAKAYKELEQRIGSAPSEYDLSKGESWIEPDYEPFMEMAEYAKSRHVPQDVMDKMLESVGKYLDEFKTDPMVEIEKLGGDAKDRLKKLNNWARSNLSEQTFAVLSAHMKTADAIQALEEIRGKMMSSETRIPSNNESSTESSYNMDDWRSELNSNLDKYKTDKKFRDDMQRKLEMIKKIQE